MTVWRVATVERPVQRRSRGIRSGRRAQGPSEIIPSGVQHAFNQAEDTVACGTDEELYILPGSTFRPGEVNRCPECSKVVESDPS